MNYYPAIHYSVIIVTVSGTIIVYVTNSYNFEFRFEEKACFPKRGKVMLAVLIVCILAYMTSLPSNFTITQNYFFKNKRY